MILVLDAGNARIKWGLWADGFVAHGSIPSERAAQLFDALHVHARPSRAIGCNVAGPQVRQHVEAALQGWRMPVEWIASRAEQCGVRSRYEDPVQLGSDRWAALIGTHARRLGDAVVVDCGTAVTVDALAGDGEFLGGLILPGIALMQHALARGTAELPLGGGVFEPFPRNSANAIYSGAVQAICGAIERMRTLLLARGADHASVVLCGGDAQVVAPLLTPAPLFAPALVLEGLVEITRA
ncbi:MAG: type III pantothenate kinase [Burkholderiales bacterium]|nr:type III pantothenate kinase [Burkholderiales bacterium]